MAIALVGQAGIAGVSNTSPQTITRTTTAGNTLVLAGHHFDNNSGAFVAPTSITDTASQTWAVSTNSAQSALTVQQPSLCSLTSPSDGASSHIADWCAWVFSSGSVTSATLAWEGGVSTFQRVALAEYSGVGAFVHSWAGGTTSAVSSLTATLNLPVPGCLVVGAVDFGGGGTQTNPTGWTTLTSAGGGVGYVLPSVTGAYSPVFSISVAANCAGALAVFAPVSLMLTPQGPRTSSWA